MNTCTCCNGNLLPSDKVCDWCRTGACSSLPCDAAHSPHDAEMAAARDADRVARVAEGGGL